MCFGEVIATYRPEDDTKSYVLVVWFCEINRSVFCEQTGLWSND